MTQEEYINCLPPYYRYKLLDTGRLEYEDLRDLVRLGHGWLAVNFTYLMGEVTLLSPYKELTSHTFI